MSAPSPAVVVAGYEAARAWAIGAAEGGGRPPGLALLLRRGLPAWLAAWETWLPMPGGTDEPPGVDTASSGAQARALAVVLATMVEHCRRDRRDREER